jgi:penicillin-binding protein 1A
MASERRVFVPFDHIPRRLIDAFVSAEDQNFWDHAGVDPQAVLRAAVTNFNQFGSGRRSVGASTITQQVAKNMITGGERSLVRKVREAILAGRIEEALTKPRILEIYLNEIFLGASAYGVVAAAQAYFGKTLDDLTLAEVAFLAALPKGPNNYNPARFPEAARIRRDWVIDRMAADGRVTLEQAEAAKAEHIMTKPSNRTPVVSVGQYFTEEVRRELISRFGSDRAMTGGLVVRTSLDIDLQADVERALRNGLVAYDRRRGGWRGPVTRIALSTQDDLTKTLSSLSPPAGMPSDWRLAAVLSTSERDARLAWVEGNAEGTLDLSFATMPLEEAVWARRSLENDRFGPQPRRMADVVAPGDVVMVERLGAVPAAGRTPGRPERLTLRQIPQVEGAIVALEPERGRVLAMAGGWSYSRSQFNRATQAMRQPGSSFKPFVYLAALEAGIAPTQRFLDGPIEISTSQGPWRPSNYQVGSYNGMVTIRTALEKSLNLVTVRVADQIGMSRIIEVAERFGVAPNLPPYISFSLGSGETTVLRMAGAYASFANGGRRVVPSFIDSAQDSMGSVIWRPESIICNACDSEFGAEPNIVDRRSSVTDQIAAYQMTHILTGVVQRGTGVAAGRGLGRPVAGKTGTTNDYKDNWFVGFTPELVVAVWIGFDDSHSLGAGETGGQNAAPIFRDVVEAALRGRPAVPFRAPAGIALARVPLDGGGTIVEALRPELPPEQKPIHLDGDANGKSPQGGAPSPDLADGLTVGGEEDKSSEAEVYGEVGVDTNLPVGSGRSSGRDPSRGSATGILAPQGNMPTASDIERDLGGLY